MYKLADISSFEDLCGGESSSVGVFNATNMYQPKGVKRILSYVHDMQSLLSEANSYFTDEFLGSRYKIAKNAMKRNGFAEEFGKFEGAAGKVSELCKKLNTVYEQLQRMVAGYMPTTKDYVSGMARTAGNAVGKQLYRAQSGVGNFLKKAGNNISPSKQNTNYWKQRENRGL